MGAYIELQCDGLVGPTHNYAGLSHGNVASQANAESVSYPRQAALQGLEKMRLVASLGVVQLVMPPPPRPNLALLRALGFDGDAQGMRAAAAAAPSVLRAAWSASAMWAANMATVSPAPDTKDGRLHLSPANLAATLHRQQEAAFAHEMLEWVFGSAATVHAPLPACVPLTDEGAANHLRLCDGHGAQGVEIFVYGKRMTDDRMTGKTRSDPLSFPARQTREASEALARRHGVKQAVFVRQTPQAIDAGVFHNDVIAMSNERLLIYHEAAFCDEAAFLAEVKQRFPALMAVRISQEELPLELTVASYFFNSQLLSLPDGGMAVIAPAESAEILQAKAVFDRLVENPAIPVRRVHYLDLRESMKNGGGPACLRLRVPLEEAALEALPQALLYRPELHDALRDAIERHYPERLSAAELLREETIARCRKAYAAVARVLALPALYLGEEMV